MSKLLQLKDMRIAFGKNQVVKGVNLSLHAGETLSLVGESGSGKSVTALSILKLIESGNAQISGEVYFNESPLHTATDKQLRAIRGNDIGMIFQEPMTALNPLHNIGKQIAEPLSIHQKLSKVATLERIHELLEMVGLSHMQNRLDAYPHQLSGGERQRVMIAMAMANNPKLLIADEPTTALDVSLQRHILQLLKKLQKEHGLAMLFITHDLPLVRKISDRVAVMRHGEIVEENDTKSLFANPQHYYTQSLLGAEASGAPRAVKDEAEAVLEAGPLKLTYGKPPRWYRPKSREKHALQSVSLSLKQGETLGVVGESGSGKTSLALSLLRMIPVQGPVVFLGRDITTLSSRAMRALRGDIQYVFQDPFGSLNPRMTVGDIIGEGLHIHTPELDKAAREMRILDMLEKVGLEPEMLHRYPHEFSGGQRQRIAIARTMILQPKLVILDEPTSALDLTLQAQIIELLRSFQESYGISYIFISHDLRVVRAMSHRLMVLKNGEVVEEGESETLYENPQHPYTLSLMQAAYDEVL